MTTLYEKARALQRLLRNKERWTQGSLAINSAGIDVSPNDSRACKFCLIGGIAHVEGLDIKNAYSNVATSDLGHLVKQVIYGVRGSEGVGDQRSGRSAVLYGYNDDESHEAVMEVVNTAVEMARGAQEAGVEV